MGLGVKICVRWLHFVNFNLTLLFTKIPKYIETMEVVDIQPTQEIQIDEESTPVTYSKLSLSVILSIKVYINPIKQSLNDIMMLFNLQNSYFLPFI
jgi:hypothetical protein